jgi:uncharacterized protein YktA (UPF0223 family)
MGTWKKFESTVVRLKRSYEDTRSVVCLTKKGRQLERNFEELKPASLFSTVTKMNFQSLQKFTELWDSTSMLAI